MASGVKCAFNCLGKQFCWFNLTPVATQRLGTRPPCTMCGKCCCKGKVADEQEKIYKPYEERKCTDCLFCILFLVFWLGMVIIAATAVGGGDPKRLLYGVDHEEKVCGGSDRSDKPRIYYPRITEDIINFVRSGEQNPLKIKLFGLCVAECPSAGDIICTTAGRTAVTNYKDANSDPNMADIVVYTRSYDYDYWVSTGGSYLKTVKSDCWVVPLPTKEYFFRCLWQRNKTVVSNTTCVEPPHLYGIELNGAHPNVEEACVTKRKHEESDTVGAGQDNPLLDQMFDAAEQMGRYVSDGQKAFVPILVCGGVFGLIMGFVWMLILQLLAGCMVWTTIILVVLLLIIGTFYAYFKAGILTQDHINAVADGFNNAAGTSVDGPEAPPELDAADSNVRSRWKYFAFFMTAVTVIIFLLVIVLRKKIRRAVAMIKEAAKSVKAMPMLMLFPVRCVAAWRCWCCLRRSHHPTPPAVRLFSPVLLRGVDVRSHGVLGHHRRLHLLQRRPVHQRRHHDRRPGRQQRRGAQPAVPALRQRHVQHG